MLSLCSCSSDSDKFLQEKLPVQDIKPKEDILYTKEEFDIGGELKKPEKMAIDDEYLYICDTGNDKIIKYGLNNNQVEEIGYIGSGKGEFNTPKCIAVNDDKLCVYDFGNDRIQLLTKQGDYISEYSIKDNFSHSATVVDVEINSDDEIYFSLISYGENIQESGVYCLSENKAELLKSLLVGNMGVNFSNNDLYYFSKYETQIDTEWKTGYAEFGVINQQKIELKKGISNMYSSIDITVVDNQVYVYDDCGQAIDEFNFNGEYQKTIFSEPVENDFSYSGFCSDSQGNLYLSDKNNNAIYILKRIDRGAES